MAFVPEHPASLRTGSAAQRRAYHVWQQLKIEAVLAIYSPCLVGTFPLDLAVAGSDLDVVCEMHELLPFEQVLARHFGHYAGFGLRRTVRQGLECSVSSFVVRDLPVEVFGQPVPSRQQFGYRHLLLELRILELGGTALRTRLQQLRAAGLKTEAAFVRALALPASDPYEALLTLENLSDAELRALLGPALGLA